MKKTPGDIIKWTDRQIGFQFLNKQAKYYDFVKLRNVTQLIG